MEGGWTSVVRPPSSFFQLTFARGSRKVPRKLRGDNLGNDTVPPHGTIARGTARGGFAQAEPGHRLCKRSVRRGRQLARAFCLPHQRRQRDKPLSIQR